jgi:hypothetical protein
LRILIANLKGVENFEDLGVYLYSRTVLKFIKGFQVFKAVVFQIIFLGRFTSYSKCSFSRFFEMSEQIFITPYNPKKYHYLNQRGFSKIDD